MRSKFRAAVEAEERLSSGVRALNAAFVIASWGLLIARIAGLLSVSWWLVAGVGVFTYFVWPGIALSIRGQSRIGTIGAEREAQQQAEQLFFKGVAEHEAGDHAAALTSFDRGLSLAPNNVSLLTNRGNALVSLGRADDAVGTFEKALRVDPSFPDAWSGYAQCLAELGRQEDALIWYAKRIAHHPSAADYFNHGHTLVRLARLDEALDSLDRALTLDPQLVSAKDAKAIALGRTGRHEAALRLFHEVVVARPTEPAAYFNVGKALSDLGRHQEALASFEKAIELNGDDADAWNNKGYSLEQLGNEQAAVQAYGRCLVLVPDHSVARANMARLRQL